MRSPMARRVELRARRLHDMMRRLDLDAVALMRLQQGNVYAQVRSRCLSCGTSDECLRWLDEPPQMGRRPDFCPSLSLLDACKRTL